MTLPQKDYYLIPDNDAKNLLTAFFIYIKFLLLLLKDYYLIPSKGTKNLLTKIELLFLIIKMVLSMILLKIYFGYTTAIAQVVQVIKVNL